VQCVCPCERSRAAAGACDSISTLWARSMTSGCVLIGNSDLQTNQTTKNDGISWIMKHHASVHTLGGGRLEKTVCVCCWVVEDWKKQFACVECSGPTSPANMSHNSFCRRFWLQNPSPKSCPMAFYVPDRVICGKRYSR